MFEFLVSTRSANLPWPAMAGAIFRPRERRVSHILVWRYVRPFVPNNNYSVCNCNRIGGFARDDGLPQHLAAVSLGPHFFAGGSLTVHPASTVRLEGNDNDPD